MVGTVVAGPSWSRADSGRYAGRYPLAVERHVMREVGRLLPGITTVTPHARYYLLHALVAAEAERRALAASETQALLRRCEVVLGAVSTVHADPHPGFNRAHGAEKIAPEVAMGSISVVDLAAPRAYVQAGWGFWGPYAASEILLGLVDSRNGGLQPGEGLDVGAVRAGLGGILDLADKDRLDLADLRASTALCLCGATESPDGNLLRRLMFAEGAPVASLGYRRSQTIRMLLRLVMHRPTNAPGRDLWPVLAFDGHAAEDDVLRVLDVTPAWTGVVLRGRSVAAWRNLWSWLVGQIGGFTPIHALAHTFADTLPNQTVRAFRADLPAVTDARGRPLPAEVDSSLSELPEPVLSLALLVLGAHRVGTFDGRSDPYFEGRDEQGQQLTPTWFRNRLEDWNDRPLRDFAAHLALVLIERSQRIALRKARYDGQRGVLLVPTRVFLRDQHVFRDSGEAGGGVGLRWDQLATVLAGLGLLHRNNERWEITDRGMAVA